MSHSLFLDEDDDDVDLERSYPEHPEHPEHTYPSDQPEHSESAQDSSPQGRVRWGLVLSIAALVIAAVVLLGALMGLRAFIMETPSMGTAAPVGSLVITAPVQTSEVRVGDVVTFTQSGSDQTHTHRVISLGPDGIRTKGDINGAQDPVALEQSMLVGKAVILAPVMGWVMKMVPIMVVVLLLGMLLTRKVKDPVNRFRYRVMSFFFGLAIALAVVQPLLGAKLLWLRVDSSGDDPHATASVVSTGLLPISVAPAEDRGTPTHALSPTGTVGEATATWVNDSGHFIFYPHLSLTLWWWVGLVAFCLLPFLWLGLHQLLRNKAETMQVPDETVVEGVA